MLRLFVHRLQQHRGPWPGRCRRSRRPDTASAPAGNRHRPIAPSCAMPSAVIDSGAMRALMSPSFSAGPGRTAAAGWCRRMRRGRESQRRRSPVPWFRMRNGVCACCRSRSVCSAARRLRSMRSDSSRRMRSRSCSSRAASRFVVDDARRDRAAQVVGSLTRTGYAVGEQRRMVRCSARMAAHARIRSARWLAAIFSAAAVRSTASRMLLIDSSLDCRAHVQLRDGFKGTDARPSWR